MMSAQPSDSQPASGERGASGWTVAARHAQKVEQDERSPDRPVEHVEPWRCSDESAERESGASQHARAHVQSELAAQKIAEEGGQEMDCHVIRVQEIDAQISVLQRQEL